MVEFLTKAIVILGFVVPAAIGLMCFLGGGKTDDHDDRWSNWGRDYDDRG